MGPRKGFANINVSEHFRIQTEKILRSFTENVKEELLQFPATLNNNERAFIHQFCQKSSNLTSKSKGKEPNRFITVYKKSFRMDCALDQILSKKFIEFKMAPENLNLINEFLMSNPLSRDKNEIIRSKQKNICVDNIMGQLTYGSMQVPNMSCNSELLDFRTSLPIWPLRENLMEMIISNQVIIVCGETGSGKTTQLPQFILDYCSSVNEQCRIICTQPRRISAVSVAERVATERGERIGQTVGFHIRLESSVGPKTALIYCTNGILLRTLMNGDSCLKILTHIIVDEIHERDRYSDFLLICLRECLVNHPHLRLILMSATMDINRFQKYFNNAPVTFVPGRLHKVDEYYLDEILQMINYESPAMIAKKKKMDQIDKKKTDKNTENLNPPQDKNDRSLTLQNDKNLIENDEIFTTNDPDVDIEICECIEDCFNEGSEESFSQFLYLIFSEQIPINFQNPETGHSGLMAAAFHGNFDICRQLIMAGAKPNLVSKENLTAIDLAMKNNHFEVIELLKSCLDQSDNAVSETDIDRKLTELYMSTITNDTPIDFDLLLAVLFSIHSGYDDFGSILVFLPGYDDIIVVRDRINGDPKFNSVRPYQTFTLHGSMSMAEQHKVFNPLKNRRKIILSTNIAETSITINDVIYVVDCGKVKETCYDAIAGVKSLQSVWISQACAKQRAGRAGRVQPGICFHLYTKYRSIQMNDFSTPEILRMPLHELCLQTKMLAPKNMRIANFLARAIEPPSSLAVQTAINHLQEIEALDFNEDLTVLGNHLVDLPVEPRLAKMLIYAVVFKCLDPILTIVSTLAYREPFMLPKFSQQKAKAEELRRSFSLNTFSDHMILLRVFQAWQDARHNKSERQFCAKYLISSATMEMIVDIRSQLLAQLRATGFVRTRPPGDIRELNCNSNNWPLVKAILTVGFYPNVAQVNKDSGQIKTKNEKKIILHHSSSLRDQNSKDHSLSLRKLPANFLIFEELSKFGINYTIKSCTNISALTVALFCDTNNLNSKYFDAEIQNQYNENSQKLILNNWILFEGDLRLKLVSDLREKISNLVTKRILYPQKNLGNSDEKLISVIAKSLLQEDVFLNFFQPSGIGQRPKTFLITNYPMVNNVIKDNRNFSNNKNSSRVPDFLKFKKINTNGYNQYLPHFVNSELENFDNASNFQSKTLNFQSFQPENTNFQQPKNFSQSFETDSCNFQSYEPENFQPKHLNSGFDSEISNFQSKNSNFQTFEPRNSHFQSKNSNFQVFEKPENYVQNYEFLPPPYFGYEKNSLGLSGNVMESSNFVPFLNSQKNSHSQNSDVNILNQNLLMLNLYNRQSDYQNLNLNDFELNGVTVTDFCDEFSEGACALAAPKFDKNFHNNFDPNQTSYFIIKAGGLKSIEISISKKTWIFSPQTERKLLRLLHANRIVILIFTVQGTGVFQGIARLLGGPLTTIADTSSQSSLACPVEWLSRTDIPYADVRHLFNPSCSDGLELSPEIGIQLSYLFANCQPKPPIQNEPFDIPTGRAIRGMKYK